MVSASPPPPRLPVEHPESSSRCCCLSLQSLQHVEQLDLLVTSVKDVTNLTCI